MGRLPRESVMEEKRPSFEASPSCDECRKPTLFRASMFDPRKDRYVRIYDCPTCKRLYWED